MIKTTPTCNGVPCVGHINGAIWNVHHSQLHFSITRYLARWQSAFKCFQNEPKKMKQDWVSNDSKQSTNNISPTVHWRTEAKCPPDPRVRSTNVVVEQTKTYHFLQPLLAVCWHSIRCPNSIKPCCLWSAGRQCWAGPWPGTHPGSQFVCQC